jgi:predicted nucleotidyltransferase
LIAPTISDAIEIVLTALNELDVVYAIIGGSACRILGSQRVTEDVDLVIALTETTPSAED